MKPCYSRLHIALDDVSHANLLPHLPRAVRFIAQALQGGGRVMVHCAAGISRSATVGCWAACYGRLHACQPQSTTVQRLHCAGGSTCSNIWLPCTRSVGQRSCTTIAASLMIAFISLACMHCCTCFLQAPPHSMPGLPVRPGTSDMVRHTGLASKTHCLKVQVMTAYLMSSEQLGAEAALFSLLKKAPWVHPNDGFLRQVGAPTLVAQQDEGPQVQGLDCWVEGGATEGRRWCTSGPAKHQQQLC